MFIIVTIAATVTDRPWAGRGRQDRWSDTDPSGIACHACDTEFKARQSRGSHSLHPWPASFWRGPCSLSCLRFWSRFRSVHSWVQFLFTAESSPGLPMAPNCGKLGIGFVYSVLFLLLLLLLLFLLVLSVEPF